MTFFLMFFLFNLITMCNIILALWLYYIYSLLCLSSNVVTLLALSPHVSAVGEGQGQLDYPRYKQEAPRLTGLEEVFHLASIHTSIFFLMWMLLDRSCTFHWTLAPLFPPSVLISGLVSMCLDLWPPDWQLCEAPYSPKCCDLGTTFISSSQTQAGCLFVLTRTCFQFCLYFPAFWVSLFGILFGSASKLHVVVHHQNRGWRRPPGLPLSLPGCNTRCRALSSLPIAWYLQ